MYMYCVFEGVGRVFSASGVIMCSYRNKCQIYTLWLGVMVIEEQGN